MVECVLSHCKNYSDENGSVTFFRLPSQDTLREEWLNALNLEELPNPDETFVCSAHFTPECFSNGDLTPDSIPTLNLVDNNSLLTDSESDVMKKEAERDISFRIFGYTCRICGCSTEDIENMESILDETNDLVEKIGQCLPIIVHESDGLPLYMCMDCVDELEATYKFIQKAVNTEDTLLHKLDSCTQNVGKVEKRTKDQEMTQHFEKNEDEMAADKVLTLNGPFTCDFCCEMFEDAVSFNLHLEAELEYLDIPNEPSEDGKDIQIVCSLCGFIFASADDYEEHKSSKVVKCEDCCVLLTTVCDQIRHRQNNCQEKYHCTQCFKTFASNQLFEFHKKKHITNNLHCYVCETSCDSLTNFINHSCNMINYLEHKPVRREPSTKISCKLNVLDDLYSNNRAYGYKCAICERLFKRPGNLAKHWAIHEKERNVFKCKHCHRSFNTGAELTAHVQLDHSRVNKIFVCRFCGKSMTTKLSLNIHERIHMHIKPYICEWCGNKFRSKANLSQHQAKHTGIRNHQCGVCGKLFSRKSFVTTHMRTHTGERPYRCELCDQRFSQVGDMKRHRKRHDTMIERENKKSAFKKTVIIVDQRNLEYINANQPLANSIQIMMETDNKN